MQLYAPLPYVLQFSLFIGFLIAVLLYCTYFYPNRAVNDGLPISLHTVAFIPTIEVRVVTAN